MPDITMCTGGECPYKEKCYRHRARPDIQQAWFDRPPFKGDECEFFIQYKKKEKK